MDWQLADAKNRFSELMNQALAHGPQRVRRRNQAVIVVSEEEYLRLVGPQSSFKDCLLSGPDLGDLDCGRDPRPGRDVQL